jgi:hypothetical protein
LAALVRRHTGPGRDPLDSRRRRPALGQRHRAAEAAGDWEGWGRAPEGVDAATLCAYSLLQPDTAARVRDTFPVLGGPASLAAEATVCAQLLQTVARGDNLVLKDQLQDWAGELRHR